MVSSVYWEWELLFISIKLGIKLAFFYDMIRIFRMVKVHMDFWISLEDFFFWVYAATMMLHLQLTNSEGILRGFSVLGMLTGMFFYGKLLGGPMLKLAEKGIKNTKRQLTEGAKLFKIKLCKQYDVFHKNRSKHGGKKNSCKEEEAE